MPSGTVTFLFSDIAGSTRRWELFPEAMKDALRRHDALLTAVVTEHDGHVFKTVGDAFCTVFHRPLQAVEAAIAIRRTLSENDWSAVEGLRVRIGMHTGTSDERGGDYFGPALNRVARLMASGHGGQILVSEGTAELVRGHLSAGVTLRSLGAHRLKDLQGAEPIFEVLSPDERGEFPPLNSMDSRPNNLPLQPTAFIGREAELAESRRLFAGARLITLAGPGGVGKTRLAIQLAADVSEVFSHGVWFVDLASLSDGIFVASAVLSTVGVREEAGRDTRDTLIDYFQTKNALIVLDNCEHVVTGVIDIVDRMLRNCPNLRVLATSREVLGNPGETVYRVSTFGDDEGAELFATRARAATPAFSLTPENAEIVKRICTRLDGIALAIELAAARLKMMSLEELWKRLDDRFRVLTGGSRTTLPRQQTLRGLIEWSFNLLEDSEKVLLRRLAIFAGDFSIDAATSLCEFVPLEELSVLDVLGRLIDKSLVSFRPEEDRHGLLESTKEFALERLTQAGERELMERRRAEHLRALAQASRLAPGAGDSARAEISRDYAEYRSAMQWALAGGDRSLGAAIGVGLSWYWSELGQWREGRYWLERIVECDAAEIGMATLASAHSGLALQYSAQGEFGAVEAQARRADECYAIAGDAQGRALAQTMIAVAANHAGRFEESLELYQSALAIFRERNDSYYAAVTLSNIADLRVIWKSDLEESAALYAQSLDIFRERGDSDETAVVLGNWSAVAAYAGEFARAESLARESLELFRVVGNETRITEQLIRVGHYRIWAGEESPDLPLREAVERLRASTNTLYLARVSEACAELACDRARHEPAAQLFGFSNAWRELKNLTRSKPLHQRLTSSIELARSTLGAAGFAAAWEDGRNFTPDDALDACAGLLDRTD
jgi:predicted ATPase/class 3 adenylate cyclase